MMYFSRLIILVIFLWSNAFDANPQADTFRDPVRQQAALKIASDGIALLKNKDDLLPLDITRLKILAVIGESAIRQQAPGDGSSEIKALYEITPLQGLIDKVADSANVVYAKSYSDHVTQGMIERAVDVAKIADVAIIFTGLSHRKFSDAEGTDRLDIKLPFRQDEMITAVTNVNPNTIVVNISGSPVEMPWVDQVPAIVQAWYSGMEAGTAIAQVLFGDVNPSGKLPFTFPIDLEDSPAHAMGNYPGNDSLVIYEEGIYVGYRYYEKHDIDVLFPFGHGLSYTTFEYRDLTLENSKDDENIAVAKVVIKNSGDRAGAEIV